jgi:hypothetical protein
MIETAIGDGTILAGLFWLVLALAGLLIAAAIAFAFVMAVWKGWDVFGAASKAWERIQGFWQTISSRFKQ